MRLASFKEIWKLPGRYESSTGTQKAGITFGIVTGWPWESEVAFEATWFIEPLSRSAFPNPQKDHWAAISAWYWIRAQGLGVQL